MVSKSKPKSIYKMILEGDDIRWQTVIYELIRSGKVNPWDIDVSSLAREYIKILKNLKRMNFNLSGKVILAASIMLKIKTRELGLTSFMEHTDPEWIGYGAEEVQEALTQDEIEEEQAIAAAANQYGTPQLVHKIPTGRTRPVTVFELMKALKKAINVQERREVRQVTRVEAAKPQKHTLPKKVDIYKKIHRVHGKLKELTHSLKSDRVGFEQICRSGGKKDKVWTFVPLLHLTNDGKVDLHQEMPFGKIFVEMKK